MMMMIIIITLAIANKMLANIMRTLKMSQLIIPKQSPFLDVIQRQLII